MDTFELASPKLSISLRFPMQKKSFSLFSQWIVSFSSLVRPGKLFINYLTNQRFSGQPQFIKKVQLKSSSFSFVIKAVLRTQVVHRTLAHFYRIPSTLWKNAIFTIPLSFSDTLWRSPWAPTIQYVDVLLISCLIRCCDIRRHFSIFHFKLKVSVSFTATSFVDQINMKPSLDYLHLIEII